LAPLQTHFDVESGVVAISEGGQVLLCARMTDAEGCRLVSEFFTNFLGDAVNGPLRDADFRPARPWSRFCCPASRRAAAGRGPLLQSGFLQRRLKRKWRSSER
jgi:N-acyl-L-homoserine lactone synthetase